MESLNNIVFARIVQAEAERLGIRLDAKEVEDAHDLALENLRQLVQVQAPGMTIDEFVRDRLGMNPEAYRLRSRQYAIIALLMTNVVRTWLLANDHAFVRMAALADETSLLEFKEALQQGGDFVALAKIYSLEPEEERGQLLPVARDEGFLADIAFATPEGEIGGPFDLGGSKVLVLVEEKAEGLDSSWPLGEARVRKSLERHPLAEYEFVQWREVMQQRYRIDFRPFFRLLYGADAVMEPDDDE